MPVDKLAEERYLDLKSDINLLFKKVDRLLEKMDAHIVEDTAAHSLVQQHVQQIETLNEKVIEGNGQPSISNQLTQLIAWSKSFESSIKLERKFLYAVLGALCVAVFVI
jgi:hypothetical protein